MTGGRMILRTISRPFKSSSRSEPLSTSMGREHDGEGQMGMDLRHDSDSAERFEVQRHAWQHEISPAADLGLMRTAATARSTRRVPPFVRPEMLTPK